LPFFAITRLRNDSRDAQNPCNAIFAMPGFRFGRYSEFTLLRAEAMPIKAAALGALRNALARQRIFPAAFLFLLHCNITVAIIRRKFQLTY
jgi:hypothetical protein